jgi:predicted TIM-barrel enzyme
MELLRDADGAIVGTSLKENGSIEKPIDETRVRELMKSVQKLR